VGLGRFRCAGGGSKSPQGRLVARFSTIKRKTLACRGVLALSQKPLSGRESAVAKTFLHGSGWRLHAAGWQNGTLGRAKVYLAGGFWMATVAGVGSQRRRVGATGTPFPRGPADAEALGGGRGGGRLGVLHNCGVLSPSPRRPKETVLPIDKRRQGLAGPFRHVLAVSLEGSWWVGGQGWTFGRALWGPASVGGPLPRYLGWLRSRLAFGRQRWGLLLSTPRPGLAPGFRHPGIPGLCAKIKSRFLLTSRLTGQVLADGVAAETFGGGLEG